MNLQPKHNMSHVGSYACTWLAVACLLGHSLTAFGNNAGGFTSLVTTPVTTGTETVNGHNDRYLDNGILHVSIQNNGNVDSIKYLKPGSPGTPKANGIEMVSQSGVNFGNHTAIYYYLYPDSTGDAAYTSTTTSSTNITLGYLRTYNPAVHSVVANVELYYLLGKGNTALYCYMIVKHPASFASYTNDLNISFIQCIWPTAHDTTNFLCENSYVDDGVKYGLKLNGVYQKRNGLQPNFYDGLHTIGVPGFPGEIVQYTTGVFAGCTNGKYSYTFDYPKLDTFGMASDVNKLGLWFVTGGHEYQNNGPTACEYSGGIGGLVTFEPLIAHYANTGLSVSRDANWTKIYGPWMLYFNSQSNGAACWLDSQNQAKAEKAAWPYGWLTNSVYQKKSQRATVSGKLVIHDALRPQTSAAGAWIGLAAPDNGTENAADNWQFQSDGYQFWSQCAADGTFALPPVATISPYGGSATYQLYAYSAGTNGAVGEFSTGPFTFAPGTVTNLGTLTWNVPHAGSQVLWEIGFPDRTAGEFRHGDEHSVPGLWLLYTNEFANPLEYYIASNNWATAFNFCHLVDGMSSTPWKWHLNFNLPSVKQGTYWLNIAYSTANSYQIIRVNNDSSQIANYIPDNSRTSDSTYLRQGLHSKYVIAHVPIPASKLNVGTNFITLDHEWHSDHARNCFMYDYISLEAPLPQLTWHGDGTVNTWNVGLATNWFDGSDLVPYTDLSSVMFDNTGASSPAINLAGALQPGSLTVNAGKDYTFTNGSLFGKTSLSKAGTGTLTLHNTNSYTGNTTVSNGTLLVNGFLSSPVTVVNGTLGGSGTVAANVALGSGATLAPGKWGLPGSFTLANTLTVTNFPDTNGDTITSYYTITNHLALTNSNLRFDLAANTSIGGGVNDLVRLNGGTLTLAGTNLIQPNLVNGALVAGTYTLIAGGNATVGSAANLAWNGPMTNTRQTYTLDTSIPGTVRLLVTNNPGVPPLSNSALLWLGTNGNTWDLTNTTNWLNGSSADKFYNFDAVTFNDAAANGSITVSGTVQPAWLLVTNTVRSYTLGGGPIGGTATLTKNGAGILQISSSGHTYTGGTVINSGTLQLNDLAGLGGGQITLSGGVLKSAYGNGNGFSPTNDIVVPMGATAAIYSGNRFAPSGRLLGSGTLNLTNTSSQNRCDLKGNWSEFAGTLNIIGTSGNNGIRFIKQGGAFSGFDNASVHLDGVGSDPQLFSSGLIINFGALSGTSTAVLRGASLGGTTTNYTTYSIGALGLSTTFAGSFQDSSGKALLVKVGTGKLTLSGTNTYSGSTTITSGTLQIGSGTTTGTLGTNSIFNSGTLAFNRSDAISDANLSLITGAGHFAQNGSGTYTITKAQPYTGSTFINAGTLALSGFGAVSKSAELCLATGAVFDVKGTASGSVTLASGQTVSGSGLVRGDLTVGSGAKLSPGVNGFGALVFSNNLVLAPLSTTVMDLGKSPFTNDQVIVQSLSFGGTLTVNQVGVGALAPGDSFRLFTMSSHTGAFDTVQLPALPPGLAWYTNVLLTTGTLTVVSTAPPTFNSLTPRADGNFSLSFGGQAGVAYEIRATTNLALTPITSWNLLGSGVFDLTPAIFDDLQATNYPLRFYLIRLP